MLTQEVLEARYIDKVKLYMMLARAFGKGNFQVEVSDIANVNGLGVDINCGTGKEWMLRAGHSSPPFGSMHIAPDLSPCVLLFDSFVLQEEKDEILM